jgi:hypothetical protein
MDNRIKRTGRAEDLIAWVKERGPFACLGGCVHPVGCALTYERWAGIFVGDGSVRRTGVDAGQHTDQGPSRSRGQG